MNVYVPHPEDIEIRRGFSAAEQKAEKARLGLYSTGIMCAGVLLAIMALAIQLEQHSKCRGIEHSDKVSMIRLLDGINR